MARQHRRANIGIASMNSSRSRLEYISRASNCPMEPLLTNLLSEPLPARFTAMQSHHVGGGGVSESGSPSLPMPSSPQQQEVLPRESASYSRRRAATACLVCRSRKTKCDNRRPVCGFCAATGGACTYPDDKTADHSKLDRGSLAILQRLSEVEHNITALLRPPGSGSMVQTPTPSQVDHHNLEYQTRHAAPHSQTSDQPPSADTIARSSDMTLESIFKWPVFEGEYPSLASTLRCLDSSKTGTGDVAFDLDPEVVVQLVENFLATNHIKNPILDINQLWAQVREFATDGLRWNGTSCLLLLICALSVLSPPIRLEQEPGFSRRSDRLARAEMYFQVSQRRIGMLYHEDSLLVIQCSFLTAVYLMTTFRILPAWKAFSQAGTQCCGRLAARGFERTDPSGMNNNFTDPEKYVEESIYWSCLKSELELRTELGLPGSSLNEIQYPHIYPSPPDPKEFLALSNISERAERDREHLEQGWFFYLAEIALRRIMNDALSSRYYAGSWYYATNWWTTAGEERFRHYVDGFKEKLEVWYAMLPPPMKFTRDPNEKVGEPLKGILRGHLIDIMDVVYFPAIQAVANKDLTEVSPYILAIAQEALSTAVYRIKICREGFWHRHQGTWIMIRTCSRSALELMSVAARAKTEPSLASMLPAGWDEAVGSVIELVQYWEEESPDLGVQLARFRQLREKIKLS